MAIYSGCQFNSRLWCNRPQFDHNSVCSSFLLDHEWNRHCTTTATTIATKIDETLCIDTIDTIGTVNDQHS